MFQANKHKDSVVHFKKSIFDEHIQEGLVSWAKQWIKGAILGLQLLGTLMGYSNNGCLTVDLPTQ